MMGHTQEKKAILYADVSGSTRIFEQYGDKLARSDIASCLELLTGLVEEYEGRVLKTIGDEVMCLFNDPLKTAMAAADMQESLRAAGEGGRFQTGILHIKIGWHYGDIDWRGKEAIGEAPVVAQQIIHKAKADEILTSAQSVEALPAEMKMNAHTIDRINSGINGEEINICIYQWEESEDVTQASAVFLEEEEDSALVLESIIDKVRVDAKHPECTIGRGHNCNLVVNGRYVSRLHTTIRCHHGNFHIRDESSNGTVIEFSDCRNVRIHREEYVLSGKGVIGIGAAPEEDPDASVSFYIK